MPYSGYELWGGEKQTIGSHSFWVVEKDLPIFVLAGHIIPVHANVQSAKTATESRITPLSLIIALDCEPSSTGDEGSLQTMTSCRAKGKFAISKSFYWIMEADREKVYKKNC